MNTTFQEADLFLRKFKVLQAEVFFVCNFHRETFL